MLRPSMAECLIIILQWYVYLSSIRVENLGQCLVSIFAVLLLKDLQRINITFDFYFQIVNTDIKYRLIDTLCENNIT